MGRIVFQPELPITPPAPDRADVACFVGLVRLASSIVPATVRRLANDKLEDVPLLEISPTDVLLVHPGEVIPVDGMVVDGWSLVDETRDTAGDALVKKGVDPGDTVVQAGTVNVTAELIVRVSKAGDAATAGTVHITDPPKDVPLSTVAAGASLRILPGETIPLDGTIISGLSLVDQSTLGLTPRLVMKGIQNPDLSAKAGSMNVSGELSIRATKAGGPVAPLSQAKRDWLKQNGWLEGPTARNCDAVADAPIPLENFAAFQSLFDDGNSADAVGTDYLAIAVRAFFGQGGKRCYVVRMGDPLGKDTSPDQRKNVIASLLGYPSNHPSDIPSAQDQKSWHGIAHLWGLPDVSFLLLPDLPALHASVIQPVKGTPVESPSGPEQFVPCVPSAPTKETLLNTSPAPRLAFDAYRDWGASLRTIVLFLSNGALREVQFVAAMPLPYDATLAGALESPSAAQAGSVHDAISSVLPEFDSQHGVSASSAFLQLAYPWLRTTNSGLLLEGLEPPDGTLAGVLARNALLQGTFTSAAKVAPLDIVDLVPELPSYETLIPDSKPSWNNGVSKPLVVRLSLFGFTPSGIHLLSDVTTYPGEAYRPARVNRLVSVISRTARRFGETHLFEDNGPRLWAQLQQTLKKFMTRMWNAGALDGATAADAFEIRCGRDTMTQNDIDAGRMIAIISFQAASVIELIQLTLTIEASGATDSEIEAQMTGAT